MCGLGLPPSKFLIYILNYMGCECWLGIPPDSRLLWYFYSPAHYEHKVSYSIGLMLCYNCQEEYLKVPFRGCWKGSSQRWFHVNFDDMPQWLHKHLLPPLIKDKWKGPEEMPQLKALIKRVTELRQAGLKACHRAKEFILW
jgi:hypothetical protein